MARSSVSKSRGLTTLKPTIAALVYGIFVPFFFRKRKTYGAGAKQVAQESWESTDQLNAAEKDGAVTYTPKPPPAAPPGGVTQVDLTITHSDGTTQVHRLTSRNPPNANANPPETNKIVITYDKEGRPTSIYIF
jgi:hypothetical protein